MGISIEAAGRFEPPGLGRGIGQWLPDLHRPLRRNQQPAEAGAIALIGGHFLTQGGETAGAFIAGTRKLHHQIGAEGSEPAALGVAEGLPAVEGDKGGIGAEHGVVRQAEAAGAVEQLQGQGAGFQGLPEQATEGAVAAARFASGGGHADQGAIGGQLQHRVGVGLTQLGELVGGEPQAAAVEERQGDRPKRLLRAQQPRASRLGGGRRLGTGWGEHGLDEGAGFQAKGGAGSWRSCCSAARPWC